MSKEKNKVSLSPYRRTEITLEEKISKNPIAIPGNPYLESIKQFGRDELISGIVNIVSTAAAEQMGLGITAKSVSGPIMEKIGFFPAHIREALKEYKAAPEKGREPLRYYLTKAFKGSMNSLALDIAIHDPLYVGMMYGRLSMYPEAPASVLAAASFGIAVIAASFIDVGIKETRYKFLQRHLKKIGFSKESYLESRFYVRNEQNPEEILDSLSKKFMLGNFESRQYHDNYLLKTRLPEYSGRKSKVRFRKRQKGKNWLQSVQIVYTRSSLMTQKKPDQFSYFPIQKDKFYFPIFHEMPESIEGIEDSSVKKELARISRGKEQKTLYREV